jgi:hypothetical protein
LLPKLSSLTFTLVPWEHLLIRLKYHLTKLPTLFLQPVPQAGTKR